MLLVRFSPSKGIVAILKVTQNRLPLEGTIKSEPKRDSPA
jgi:hypothetical protein